jgi:hypothetical protein
MMRAVGELFFESLAALEIGAILAGNTAQINRNFPSGGTL